MTCLRPSPLCSNGTLTSPLAQPHCKVGILFLIPHNHHQVVSAVAFILHVTWQGLQRCCGRGCQHLETPMDSVPGVLMVSLEAPGPGVGQAQAPLL